ncbi:MAG: ABC transporter substrate-binding protein [Coriobacteriales bacterium]|jgi:iron complex transport system substrate-binding protein|nr:ABC transporter substrate-binding protein [Coriobacteriales bacterium]
MKAATLTRRAFLGLVAAGLAAGLAPLLAGCGVQRSTKADDLEADFAAGTGGVKEFIDSAGRRVILPTEVKRISPSGSYAQIMLSTLCPELLVSLSSSFSNSQAHYLGEELLDLPVLGRYYGKNADMNYEEIIHTDPDVIIDIGEAKENIASDMDGLQKQSGLPVIFVEATLPNMDRAYAMLGEAIGIPATAAPLAAYVREVLDFAELHRAEVQQRDIRVLYGAGEYGLDVVERGSVHSGAIDALGLENVAVLGDTNSTLVSIETVMNWKPDALLLSPAEGYFSEIYEDETWASIPAVKNRRVYEVPAKPYEWLNKPPSVQTVLGLQWLGNLFVPDLYDFDIVETAQRFYELFWHYDLNASEARELMAASTFLSTQGGSK